MLIVKQKIAIKLMKNAGKHIKILLFFALQINWNKDEF
jgi:hypothetical protein